MRANTQPSTRPHRCERVVASLARRLTLLGPRSYAAARGDAMAFELRHFAGAVRYAVGGWLDKNRDALLPHAELLMLQSPNAFVRDLFLPHAMAAAAGGASDTMRARARLSLSAAFRAQLAALLASIGRCNVWHVRCVAANATKSGGGAAAFVGPHVLQQLRQVGALETVRVRRAGFALRRPFAAACRRYRALLPPPFAPPYRRSSARASSSALREPEPPSDARAACVALLESALAPPMRAQCVVARSKLFLTAAAVKLLDERVVVVERARIEAELELARARAEEERKRKAEEERKRREDEERKRREDEERKRREEQERKRKAEEEERKRKAEEEEERKRRDDDEEKRRKDDERRRRDEDDAKRARVAAAAAATEVKPRNQYAVLPERRDAPPVDFDSIVAAELERVCA